MANTREFTDNFLEKLHYDGTREYTRRVGNVEYLDGRALARPFKMPWTQRFMALGFIIIGVIIGLYILNTTVISSIQANINAEKNIATNLEREASITTIPSMSALINMDDEAIKNSFAEQGYQVYDASALYDSNDMTLYKIPSDMSLTEASALYTKGMGALDAVQATKLLNGSWLFSTDRVNGTSMVTRYADFTTSDPDTAVRNALEKEGFDPNLVTDSGIDESGNTFNIGSLDADGTLCSWKISALPLTDMYSITGLPENACYVGVRVTVA